MGKLDLAAERLTKALNALDASVVPLVESRGGEGELSALRAEREVLLARIAVLEEELQALTDISEEVENRLDGAIGEIRTALGR
jgi:molybdenum-dependent DNA-binding transcriptional regulator ModE